MADDLLIPPPIITMDEWRTEAFRASMVQKLDEAIKQSGWLGGKDPKMMEQHIFMRSNSKESYLNYVARFLLMVSKQKNNDGNTAGEIKLPTGTNAIPIIEQGQMQVTAPLTSNNIGLLNPLTVQSHQIQPPKIIPQQNIRIQQQAQLNPTNMNLAGTMVGNSIQPYPFLDNQLFPRQPFNMGQTFFNQPSISNQNMFNNQFNYNLGQSMIMQQPPGIQSIFPNGQQFYPNIFAPGLMPMPVLPTSNQNQQNIPASQVPSVAQSTTVLASADSHQKPKSSITTVCQSQEQIATITQSSSNKIQINVNQGRIPVVTLATQSAPSVSIIAPTTTSLNLTNTNPKHSALPALSITPLTQNSQQMLTIRPVGNITKIDAIEKAKPSIEIVSLNQQQIPTLTQLNDGMIQTSTSAKSIPHLTSVKGSTTRSTNKLEPAIIAPPKTCLTKTDSNEKLVMSTLQSNEIQKQLDVTLFSKIPTKDENNKVSKNISTRSCNTVQPNVSPKDQIGKEQQDSFKKIQELAKYIEPLKRMIVEIGDKEDPEKLNKMKKLLNVLSNPQQFVRMETLKRCETVLQKLNLSVEKKSKEWLLSSSLSPEVNSLLVALDEVIQKHHSVDGNPTEDSKCNRILYDAFSSVELFYGEEMSVPSIEEVRKMSGLSEVGPIDGVPDIIKKEVATLKNNFNITWDNFRPNSSKLYTVCYLENRYLPSVPPLNIILPLNYPESAPTMDDMAYYDTTPELRKIKDALNSRKERLPFKHSITQLLNAWETSVFAVYALAA